MRSFKQFFPDFCGAICPRSARFGLHELLYSASCSLSNDMSNVYLYSSVTASARETNPNTRALELIPPLPHARNNRHVTNTPYARRKRLRASTPAADTTPTSDFALRPRTRALRVTTTGPGLYTNRTNDSGLCATFPNPRANHYLLWIQHTSGQCNCKHLPLCGPSSSSPNLV